MVGTFVVVVVVVMLVSVPLHAALQGVLQSPPQQLFAVPNLQELLSRQMRSFTHSPSTRVSPSTHFAHDFAHWPNGVPLVEQQLWPFGHTEPLWAPDGSRDMVHAAIGAQPVVPLEGAWEYFISSPLAQPASRHVELQ